MLISTTPLLQKIAYVYALEWYHFIFICLSRSLKLKMSLPPLAFLSLRSSADIWVWEVPAALLSIRATDLTKQGAEACHHLSHATGAQVEQQVHPRVC